MQHHDKAVRTHAAVIMRIRDRVFMLIESFHAGPQGQRLYLSLHRPQGRLLRSTGVLLCPALGHEQFRSHRLGVKLAEQLAACGFPVLRFDYRGTGDSEGELADLDALIEDIELAAAELARRERTRALMLGGIRLGALLAAIAAHRLAPARGLFLIDPVVRGADYSEELRRLHADMLRDLERFARKRRTEDCEAGEMLGMVYPPLLLRDLRNVQFPGIPAQVDRALVIGDARDAFGTATMSAERGADYGWRDLDRIEETIVDPVCVRSVATTLQAVCA